MYNPIPIKYINANYTFEISVCENILLKVFLSLNTSNTFVKQKAARLLVLVARV